MKADGSAQTIKIFVVPLTIQTIIRSTYERNCIHLFRRRGGKRLSLSPPLVHEWQGPCSGFSLVYFHRQCSGKPSHRNLLCLIRPLSPFQRDPPVPDRRAVRWFHDVLHVLRRKPFSAQRGNVSYVGFLCHFKHPARNIGRTGRRLPDP